MQSRHWGLDVHLAATAGGPASCDTCAVPVIHHATGEHAHNERADATLVAALRAGDESAFAELLDRYYGTMIRVARTYVATKETAEDVVQETFVAVIEGIHRFEQRSSVRTWLFQILVNRAKTKGERESRTKPFSALGPERDTEQVVDPDRFVRDGRWAGFWSAPPSAEHMPDARVVAAEAGALIFAAIDALPASQRSVIVLRDVNGFSAAEVCELLDITEANQRVLLHRARSKVRAALEKYVNERVQVSG